MAYSDYFNKRNESKTQVRNIILIISSVIFVMLSFTGLIYLSEESLNTKAPEACIVNMNKEYAEIKFGSFKRTEFSEQFLSINNKSRVILVLFEKMPAQSSTCIFNSQNTPDFKILGSYDAYILNSKAIINGTIINPLETYRDSYTMKFNILKPWSVYNTEVKLKNEGESSYFKTDLWNNGEPKVKLDHNILVLSGQKNTLKSLNPVTFAIFLLDFLLVLVILVSWRYYYKKRRRF